MLDLILNLPLITDQGPIISQSTTVYLPVSTKQSKNQNCVTYIAKNTTGRSVRNVYVNRRNTQGTISKSFLTTSLAAGKTKTFESCNNSFVNVEAKQ